MLPWVEFAVRGDMSVFHRNDLSGNGINSTEVALGTADKPMVFLFPGVSGDEKELALLAAGCGPLLRSVPVRLPDWTTIDYALINLDGLVKICIAQIEVHACGAPVLLAGYSFGGHIAMAVAAAMEATGRRIGCLALLDTTAVPPTESMPVSLTRPGRRLVTAMRNGAIGAEVGRIVGAILIRIRSKRLSRFVARLPLAALSPGLARPLGDSITMSFNFPILEELLRRMTEPKEAFRFPAVLFRCTDQTAGFGGTDQGVGASDDLGWGVHLANLQIVAVPGNHVTWTNQGNLPTLCASFVAVMMERHMGMRGSAG
ncbi:MAG TPA: thioesterase domain-containing protein [Rhodopila sp.]